MGGAYEGSDFADDDDDDYGGDGDADADADSDGDTDDRDDLLPPDEEPQDPAEAACDVATAERTTQYMSADDSNSQAGPVVAREQIEMGWGGYIAQPRLYEYLNYYSFDYEPAEEGSVRIVPQLRAVEGDEGGASLLVGVVAPAMDPLDRRPLSLTFSVDASGSMGGEGIERAQAVIRAIASELREGDVVSIVTWDSSTNVVLESHAVGQPGDAEILAAADALIAGASTDLEQGLRVAYDLAEQNYMPGRTNRVILISDGGANTGITSEELIGAAAEDADDEGIYLIGVGAASGGGFADDFMDRVTDLGRGAYLYVDSEEEARRAFHGERLLAALEIAARDVRLSIDMPEWTVVEEFHGEQISQNPEEVLPQHLASNDAMLYHMTIRTCAEGGLAEDAVFRFRVTWKDRVTREDRETSIEMTAAELLGSTNTQQAKADAIIAYAKALGELPSAADPAALAASTSTTLEGALAMRPGDTDLEEIRDLFAAFSGRWR
jgi:Ca-activated chloride channel family protein